MTKLEAPTHPGVRYRPFTDAAYNQIGADLLNWRDRDQDERSRARNVALYQPGLIVSFMPDGELGTEWQASEDGSNAGELLFGTSGDGTMMLLDTDGNCVFWDGAARPHTATPPWSQGLLVPNDGVMRTVVVSVVATSYEKGRVSLLSGSTLLNGSGTEFTQYAGRNTNFPGTNPQVPGTKFRIDAADSASLAGQTYEFNTITSDTVASLVTAPSASGTVPFSIVGTTKNSIATAADRDIYQYLMPKFELVTATREPAAGSFIIADVTRTAGTLVIIDRRKQNIVKPQVTGAGSIPTPIFRQRMANGATAPYFEEVELWRDMLSPTSATSFAVCRAAMPNTMIATCTSSTIDVYLYNEKTEGSASAATSVVTGLGAAQRPGLVYVATGAASGKHILFYRRDTAGKFKVYYKVSTDQGSTWGTETLLMDPTLVDANDSISMIHAIQLLNGRICLYIAYYDDSASANDIRLVYSDDYGTVWNTNSDAGHLIFSGTDGVGNQPYAAQDYSNGTVWLTFTDSSSNIRVARSTNSLGTEAFTRSSAITERTSHNSQRPCVWASPTGHALVFYETVLPTQLLDLYYAVYGVSGSSTIPTELHIEQVKRLEDDATVGTSHLLDTGVIQLRNGSLGIWHVRPNIVATTNHIDVVRAAVLAQPYAGSINNVS